ncbi:hypothetical protein Bhyg_11893 [Pseudolycoriella hygida]|uniref:Uncharacterized protein n=1 Tax=Pseudolycoriella hygida TaxID=35572 RepID=A0A9Q0S0R7_9DIPT|nr:hypothetical protein Bhyg_11893 [Pseudolycoriella hygida]
MISRIFVLIVLVTLVIIEAEAQKSKREYCSAPGCVRLLCDECCKGSKF